MSFVLPNPSAPTNGTPGDATPILQNEVALANAIASFDGSQVQAGTLVESAFANPVNPRLRGAETLANFVYTGCIWSLTSGLQGVMTGGTIYVNGYRTLVNGIGSNTFTASQDTYVDIDYLGNVTYHPVGNNAASPGLTPNALRVAEVVTNGSTITSVVQSGLDTLNNAIYPNSPVKATSVIKNPYLFSVYLASPQNSIVGYAKVLFDTKLFDTNNSFDAVTNHRFVAPIAGYYQFNWGVLSNNSQPSQFWQSVLYKNGAALIGGSGPELISYSQTIGSGFVQLAANDYTEIFLLCQSITPMDPVVSATYFQGYLVST